MAKDHPHVVMLSWSAFGHMMPFFQLSIALAKAKVHVSFISTPTNIQRLPKISPDLQPFIHLVSIPFPALASGFLPEGAEATVDIPFEKMDNLKIAYDLLQQPIKQFIGDQLPDWIIVDFSAHWAVEIGKEFGVPWANSEADALPPGFVERTSEKGLVCLGWVAQMEILGHPSVGGSLFHSGWGSVIETLQFGHVLVVLPFIIDQPLNARLLVEKDLAVEVKRTEDESFCKDDIAKTH
ncbi:hypothetical protein ACE6H2_007846 [Prunus campanulata]